jgi:hypothetical protein
MEGCNPSRNSLAQQKEGIHKSNTYTSFCPETEREHEVVRHIVRLVAQGFTQIPEPYSPDICGITFRYVISMAVQNHPSMQLMDVVTAYLYGSLDSDI